MKTLKLRKLKPIFFKLQCVHNHLGILLKSNLGSVGLVWGLKVYISNNLPRLAEAVFLGVTLRGAR